jgi:hypothetical protein
LIYNQFFKHPVTLYGSLFYFFGNDQCGILSMIMQMISKNPGPMQ